MQIGIFGVGDLQGDAAGLPVCGVGNAEILRFPGFPCQAAQCPSYCRLADLAGWIDGKGQHTGNGVIAYRRLKLFQPVGAGGEGITLKHFGISIRCPFFHVCPGIRLGGKPAQLQLDPRKGQACPLIQLLNRQIDLLVGNHQGGFIPLGKLEHGIGTCDGNGAVLLHPEADLAILFLLGEAVMALTLSQAAFRQDVGVVMLYQPFGNGDLAVGIRCQGNSTVLNLGISVHKGRPFRRFEGEGNAFQLRFRVILIHLGQGKANFLVADREGGPIRFIKNCIFMTTLRTHQVRRAVRLHSKGHNSGTFVSIRGLGFLQHVCVPGNDALNGNHYLAVCIRDCDDLLIAAVRQLVVTGVGTHIGKGEFRAGKPGSIVLAYLLNIEFDWLVLHGDFVLRLVLHLNRAVPGNGEGHRLCELIALGRGGFHQVIGFGVVCVRIRGQTIDGDGSVRAGGDSVNCSRCGSGVIEHDRSAGRFAAGISLMNLEYRTRQGLGSRTRIRFIRLVEGHLILGVCVIKGKFRFSTAHFKVKDLWHAGFDIAAQLRLFHQHIAAPVQAAYLDYAIVPLCHIPGPASVFILIGRVQLSGSDLDGRVQQIIRQSYRFPAQGVDNPIQGFSGSLVGLGQGHFALDTGIGYADFVLVPFQHGCFIVMVIGQLEWESILLVQIVAVGGCGLFQDVITLLVDFNGEVAAFICGILAHNIALAPGTAIDCGTIEGELCTGNRRLVCLFVRIILVKGHGGLVGQVDHIVFIGAVFPGCKRVNGITRFLIRRLNVHIHIRLIAAVPIIHVVLIGDFGGKSSAIVVGMVGSIGLREPVAIAVLAQDDGFVNDRACIRGGDALATGIKDQPLGIGDRLPDQMAGVVGDSSAKDGVIIQRLHFKFRAGQSLVAGIRILRIPHNLLQIHRSDDGFIHHGQNGILDRAAL